MISKSEIVDPIGTTESVWLPYFSGHLYAAYEADDSQEVEILDISDHYDLILLKLQGTVVSVYTSRPGFLVHYPHTYDVVKIQVMNNDQKA